MQSQFVTTLTAARVPSRIEPGALAWSLVVPLIYDSAIYGRIIVPQGFETDFASVPRLPLAFLFFGDRVHAPAVIHDWLCRFDYPNCRVSWRAAAEVFLEAMQALNVPAWQRLPMYWAVRFYRSKTKPSCNKKTPGGQS